MTIKLNHANFWYLFMIFPFSNCDLLSFNVKHTKHNVKKTILYVKYVLHFFQKFLMNPLVMVLICFVTLFLIRYYAKSLKAVFCEHWKKVLFRY